MGSVDVICNRFLVRTFIVNSFDYLLYHVWTTEAEKVFRTKYIRADNLRSRILLPQQQDEISQTMQLNIHLRRSFLALPRHA
jgi:hypothetical protein